MNVRNDRQFAWGWLVLGFLACLSVLAAMGWSFADPPSHHVPVVQEATATLAFTASVPVPTNTTSVPTLLASATASPSLSASASATNAPTSTQTPVPSPSETARLTETLSPSETASPVPTICQVKITQYPYFVGSGETLFSIALQYGGDWRALAADNCLPGDRVDAGQKLYLPREIVTATPSLTETPSATVTPSPIPVLPTDLVLPDLQFGAPGYSAQEGQSVIVVVRLLTSCDCTVSVQYGTREWSARSGEDFNPLAGTLVFSPGQTEQVIQVQLLADDTPEQEELFYIWLENPVNASLIFGKQRDEIGVTISAQP